MALREVINGNGQETMIEVDFDTPFSTPYYPRLLPVDLHVATIMPEDKVNLARFDPSYLPEFDKDKSIQGVFDACFGTLFFSSEDVERIYNTTSSSSAPNIFLSIEKAAAPIF